MFRIDEALPGRVFLDCMLRSNRVLLPVFGYKVNLRHDFWLCNPIEETSQLLLILPCLTTKADSTVFHTPSLQSTPWSLRHRTSNVNPNDTHMYRWKPPPSCTAGWWTKTVSASCWRHSTARRTPRTCGPGSRCSRSSKGQRKGRG